MGAQDSKDGIEFFPIHVIDFVCVVGGRGRHGPRGMQRKKPGRMRHPGWAPYEVC